MKTALAIIGTLALIVVLAIGIGAYYVYRRGHVKALSLQVQVVEDFIAKKQPSTEAAAALRRLANAAKMQDSWAGASLLTAATSAISDGVVTDDEVKLLNEGAQMGERGPLDLKAVQRFMEKFPRPPGASSPTPQPSP